MNEMIVKQIKNARLERGLTQHDLAKHLGRRPLLFQNLSGERFKYLQVIFINSLNCSISLLEFFFGEEYGKRIFKI